MRSFSLVRSEDPSGVSGTGVVAEGVQFHDGQTVLSWFGAHHSLEVHPSVESMVAIHGHNGKTTVEWDNKPKMNKTQLYEFKKHWGLK